MSTQLIPTLKWFIHDTQSQQKEQLTPEQRIEKLCETNEKFKQIYNKIKKCYYMYLHTSTSTFTFTPSVEQFGYGKEIWNVYNDIDYLEETYSKSLGGTLIYYPPIVYMKIYYEMAHKLCKKYDVEYEADLHMDSNEVANGYKLYNITNDEAILRRSTYNDLVKKWLNNKQYTEDEFYTEYDNLACSDWSKQDEYGDCFGGYWDYPDDSYEKKNAWDLTRKANGNALYKLPFPKEVLLETIKIGCGNRMECVRYSNFLCEWVRRKMIQLNQLDPTINQNIENQLDQSTQLDQLDNLDQIIIDI